MAGLSSGLTVALISPVLAFLLLVSGLLIALVYVITQGKAPLKKSFSCAGCPSAAYCTAVGACDKQAKEDTAQ